MKRILTAVFAALMLCALTACGSSAVKTVDVQALADALKDGCAFEDTLTAVSTEQLGFYLSEMPECEAAAYMGTGTTSEEIIVAQCGDSAGAAAMKAALETHLAELKEQAGKYQPEELARLDGAILKVAGNCVVLCVTSDTGAANSILKEHLG